jgi:hypothetical protein
MRVLRHRTIVGNVELQLPHRASAISDGPRCAIDDARMIGDVGSPAGSRQPALAGDGCATRRCCVPQMFREPTRRSAESQPRTRIRHRVGEKPRLPEEVERIPHSQVSYSTSGDAGIYDASVLECSDILRRVAEHLGEYLPGVLPDVGRWVSCVLYV